MLLNEHRTPALPAWKNSRPFVCWVITVPETYASACPPIPEHRRLVARPGRARRAHPEGDRALGLIEVRMSRRRDLIVLSRHKLHQPGPRFRRARSVGIAGDPGRAAVRAGM